MYADAVEAGEKEALELELKKRAAWDPDGAFRQSGYVPCARSRNAGGCKA